MLTSAILGSSWGYLTSGVFYTAFLMGNGINIVNLGIISFLPLLANCFSVFAPMILERFEKRKTVLAAMRFSHLTLNILGVTLVPMLVKDQAAKTALFAIIVFASNLLAALYAGGYTVWHLNFIPNTIRAEYFSFQQIIATSISSGLLLVSSVIADALKDTPHQMEIITAFRFVAYALVLVEIYVMTRPKEFPYERKAEKIKFTNVFTIPLKQVKFRKTMLLIAMWTFVAHLTSSSFLYYLLDSVGVKYTFINAIDASYALFLIVFMPFWRRVLRKWSWLKLFAIAALFLLPTNLAYAFVNASNYVVLMLIVRLSQHFIGVGLNLAYANLPFLNLPKEDRSNYMVFHSLTVNLSAFLSMSLATLFISKTGGIIFNIFGSGLINVQLLMIVNAVAQASIAAVVLLRRKSLEPEALID